MHIHIIEEFGDFNAVRGDWEAVYDADPEAQFFLSWQWLADWLEIHRTVWFVLAAKHRETDPNYIAFLPLRMLTQFDNSHGLFNELIFGGTGFSDYTGILARPECEAEAVAAFADYLKRALNWARFTMHNLAISERRRQLFLAAFDESRFVHTPLEHKNPNEPTDHDVCPAIDLPAHWDDYLATLSANNRQKIRRLLRKIEASEVYRIELSDEGSFDSNLKILLDFWKIKWTPSKGAERADEIALLNYTVLVRCAAHGALFLPVLWHGDRPVAALATLIDPCKKSLLFSIAGRDESYRELPAGYLLHAYSIRHAIAHGFTTYDFLKGDEPYKYLFAPRQERRLRGCTVATRTSRNLRAELEPRAIASAIELTAELHDQGDAAIAERGYRQILEVAPDHALALYRFGRLMADNGDHAQARELLSRSVAAEPDGDNAWLCLARSLLALGQNQEALAACYEAVRLQPENEEARELLVGLGAPAAHPAMATIWPGEPVERMPAPHPAPAALDGDRLLHQQAQDIHEQIREYLDAFVIPQPRL
ncbi:MAG: GNAT family N-acetyltransferase [Stellaceae bacterium]